MPLPGMSTEPLVEIAGVEDATQMEAGVADATLKLDERVVDTEVVCALLIAAGSVIETVETEVIAMLEKLVDGMAMVAELVVAKAEDATVIQAELVVVKAEDATVMQAKQAGVMPVGATVMQAKQVGVMPVGAKVMQAEQVEEREKVDVIAMETERGDAVEREETRGVLRPVQRNTKERLSPAKHNW